MSDHTPKKKNERKVLFTKKKKKAETNSVQVAVRVRPLNSRELSQKEKVCVEMNEKTTICIDPNTGSEHKFTFDFSYWSLKDGSKEFASQETIYNDLGKSVIQQMFDGYNSCVFAYGQTGSGKSYSQYGTGGNPGIIPRLCRDLFENIRFRKKREDSNVKTFRVEVSMMEIYNEKVRDLFNPSNPKNSSGLKVRENPRTGPYVEGLTMNVAKTYEELSSMLDEGSKLRTIGSTSMNDRSSRAHTIFQIVFTQIFQWGESSSSGKVVASKQKVKKKSQRVAKVNIIDLAGSESSKKAETTGARLKEGSAINLSLTMLGNVINALAKSSSSSTSKERDFIPYRNSKLTWLLKESLGGNSKTVMLATISPAAYNCQETLSTLRYADRAKQIKNHATINEDSQTKLINELKSEIERLKKMLSEGMVTSPQKKISSSLSLSSSSSGSDEVDLQQMLNENQKIFKQLQKSEEQRLLETKKRSDQRKKMLREAGISDEFSRKIVPHMVNLNEDPSMSENLLYFFRKNYITKIGSQKKKNDITFLSSKNNENEEREIEEEGEEEEEEKEKKEEKPEKKKEEKEEDDDDDDDDEIKDIHCFVENIENEDISISPKDSTCLVLVNGKRITEKESLHTGDRIVIGREKIFRFINPNEDTGENGKGSNNVVDWEEIRVSMKEEVDHYIKQKREAKEMELKNIKTKRELEGELLKKEMERFKNMGEEVHTTITEDDEDVIRKRNALEKEVMEYKEKLQAEKLDKTILEKDRQFQKERIQDLQMTLAKFKQELLNEQQERQSLNEKFFNEKTLMEKETSKLSETLSNLRKKLKEQELEKQRKENERMLEKKNVEELKKEILGLNKKIKTEIAKKESLEEETQKLESAAKEWQEKLKTTKSQLENKTKDEIQLLPILQKIIYAQDERDRKLLQKLENDLSEGMKEKEKDQEMFEKKMKELEGGNEFKGEFVQKLFAQMDVLKEENRKLKRERMELDSNEEEKKSLEERLDALQNQTELLRIENMKLEALAKERYETINNLRSFLN